MLRRLWILNRMGANVASGNGFTRAAPSTVNIQATVSPLSPDAVKSAFEITQGRSTYKIVTVSPMNDFQSAQPDSIIIDGQVYECRNVTKSDNRVQPHYTGLFTSKVLAGSTGGVK